MTKFFLSTLVIIFIISVAWYYLPQNTKEKTASLLYAALSRDTEGVRKNVEDLTGLGDSVERRSILVEELKKNINEIKKQVSLPAETPKVSQPSGKSSNKSTNDTPVAIRQLISSSENIIKSLEEANNDSSLGSKVVDRVLDLVFPGTQKAIECREVDKR